LAKWLKINTWPILFYPHCSQFVPVQPF